MSSKEPLPRKRHAAVGVGQKLYVWAGDGPNVQTTAFESFDVCSEAWELPRHLKGASLPAGFNNMAVATDGKKAYTFGGAIGDYPYFNTLCEIDLSTLECRELIPKTTSHAPKKSSRMVYFNQKLVVHGGFMDAGVTDELMVFDLRTSEFLDWGMGNATPARGQCMVGG